MKVLTAVCGDEKIKTIWTEGAHRVAMDSVRPNTWNMNKVEPQMMEKLRLVIKETQNEAGQLPPITCRPHPKKKRLLQIIDGEHRWKILQELGHKEIDVVVLYVGTKRAMMMTAELNYNRGEPDMEKYPQYLAKMMREFDDVDAKYLSERLPDSEDEIRSYLEAADLEVDEVRIEDDDEDTDSSSGKDASETDALVEVKFVVRQGAAEVIERELSRLKAHLGGGKNERGRALEMMAVLSSQTTDGSIDSSMENEDENDVSIDKPGKKKKKKLRKPN